MNPCQKKGYKTLYMISAATLFVTKNIFFTIGINSYSISDIKKHLYVCGGVKTC